MRLPDGRRPSGICTPLYSGSYNLYDISYFLKPKKFYFTVDAQLIEEKRPLKSIKDFENEDETSSDSNLLETKSDVRVVL